MMWGDCFIVKFLEYGCEDEERLRLLASRINACSALHPIIKVRDWTIWVHLR